MLLQDAKFLVLDTETTGFDYEKDRVVQIGAVWLLPTGEIVDQFECLVNPEGVAIPPDASAIHHIVDEDVKDAVTLKQALGQIESRGSYNVIVAHNAPFDMGFIKPPAHIPVIDTLRFAKKIWPELESYKNQYIRYFHKLRVVGAMGQMAHSALPDALVTAANLIKALEDLKKVAKDPENIEVEKIIEWSNQPNLLKICKFGKHKGKTWEQISKEDAGYLTWALGPKGMTDKLEGPNADADLKFTLTYWSQRKG